jgi:hypothetical protein
MLGILEKGVVADEEKVYKINGGLNSCETMVFGLLRWIRPVLYRCNSGSKELFCLVC